MVALLAYVRGRPVRSRPRALDAGAAGLITIYADAGALVLATLAVFIEPIGYLAVAGFVFLLVRGRRASASTPACGS